MFFCLLSLLVEPTSHYKVKNSELCQPHPSKPPSALVLFLLLFLLHLVAHHRRRHRHRSPLSFSFSLSRLIMVMSPPPLLLLLLLLQPNWLMKTEWPTMLTTHTHTTSEYERKNECAQDSVEKEKERKICTTADDCR